MLLPKPSLVPLLLLVTRVVAQLSLKTLPSCAQSCLAGDTRGIGCSSYSDVACVCKKQEVISEIFLCIDSQCVGKESSDALSVAADLCKAAGVDVKVRTSVIAIISDIATTPPGSSTGTSTPTNLPSTASPSTTSSSESSNDASNQPNKLAIGLGVGLGFVFLAIAIIAAVLLLRRRKARSHHPVTELETGKESGFYPADSYRPELTLRSELSARSDAELASEVQGTAVVEAPDTSVA
ncbi:hypothetical protein BJ508DRAFT_375234 [Ascobolus immersus RN42]|uniref:CFEM domain-containing protein n=1 Tax=Ascobolus immersus RN42 TaxID=1160509 RepID=A0A3N4IEZ5_ASCIM|nr:hypothetical protein BJ508DRAFT_375234 [Ascobolus immersus RN42]